jgi:predicted Zn-dependent protease
MKILQRVLDKSVLILLVATLFATSSCVTIQTSPVSGNKRVYGYTWQQELEIGQDADSEIIAQYGLYDDPELTQYVDRLGQELLEVSHFNREDTPEEYRNTPFTFRVLNSPVVNAFALPGGYVYVTRGLLSHLDNEAQLMVVLGHEIGHVAARHASQRAADQQFGQLAIIGSAIIGESLGYDGGQILQLSGTTAQLLFLRYGRDDERESDRLGVEYSAIEGYEAAEGGKFFTSLKRISEKAGFDIPSHLSSHPDPGEREENIPRLAEEWEEAGYEQSIINRDEFLNMIDGLMYGENPHRTT